MKKAVLQIIFLVSCIILLACTVVFCAVIPDLMGKMASAGMGIIGGADTPTLMFWLGHFLLRSPLFWGAVLSLNAFFISGVWLLVIHSTKE